MRGGNDRAPEAGNGEGTGGQEGVTTSSTLSGTASREIDIEGLLDLLGIDGHEWVGHLHWRAATGYAGDPVPAGQLAGVMAGAHDRNHWFAINPTSERQPGKKGTAAKTTRWVALSADLDAKPSGLIDFATCEKVIADLSKMLGVNPVAVIHTGHGLQPLWLLERENSLVLDTGDKLKAAQALLRRFGRLVAVIADRHGGRVDSTFNLDRQHRAPGTVNSNKTGEPVMASANAVNGSPISVLALTEVLNDYDIPERPEDDELLGEEVSSPKEWTFGKITSAYVQSMIDGWHTDRPGGGRHLWALSQCIRLACGHRLGQITEADYDSAMQILLGRLTWLCANTEPRREVGVTEFCDLRVWGVAKAAGKSDVLAWAEIGGEPAGAKGDEGEESDSSLDKKQKSVATRLVDLALERYEFKVSKEGEPFAVPRLGPRVVRLLRGGNTSLRPELAKLYRAKHGRVPPSQALTDAVTVLEGEARDADPVELHLRVASNGGYLFLDLGDLTGRAVRIGPCSWSLVDQPPVLFKRTTLTGVMPEPQRGGELDELWKSLNVKERDQGLLLGFMVAAFFPNIPHPVLSLQGEQGTGKSTAAKAITSVIDPSPVPLRKPPKEAEGWITAASGSWTVAIDNLSDITPWLSDAICRAVTGEGDVRRRLYSDGDLAVFSFRRVILLNGIDHGALRGDLAERLLAISLERIEPTERKSDEVITDERELATPRVLGAVLDLLVQVLAVRPTIQLAKSPRMADFAQILACVDQVIGTKSLERYLIQSEELSEDAVTSEPALAALILAVEEPGRYTSAELLKIITPEEKPRDWPTARKLTGLLKRHAPALRDLGWVVSDREPKKGHAVVWHIVPPRQQDTSQPEMVSDLPPQRPNALTIQGEEDVEDVETEPSLDEQVDVSAVGSAAVAQRFTEDRDSTDHSVLKGGGELADIGDAPDLELPTDDGPWPCKQCQSMTHRTAFDGSNVCSWKCRNELKMQSELRRAAR